MYTTRLTFYQCIEILMEATPDDVEVDEVQAAFEKVENVVDVHDLHIWALTQGKNTLTCHVKYRADNLDTQLTVLNALDKISREKFGIHHITVQCEPEQRALQSSSIPSTDAEDKEDGSISEDQPRQRGYKCGNDIHKY